MISVEGHRFGHSLRHSRLDQVANGNAALTATVRQQVRAKKQKSQPVLPG
jgi:hypothetical protein